MSSSSGSAPPAPAQPRQLKRELGLFGAVMMGLGSIVGTGVFVGIGVAAGVAGPAVILAIVLAAVIALCNALSSAQLAANHPVSGGTYEYGYLHLHPILGFSAGWMFLCAKSASAATAALGFAGYLLFMLNGDGRLTVPIAVGAAAVLTAVVIGGIRRSNVTNIVIVSVTLAALGGFILFGIPSAAHAGAKHFVPFFGGSASGGGPVESTRNLLYATALMFVAYTGYGRIATLGEEVRDPVRTIPRAIVATLAVTATLYIAVGVVAVGVAGIGPLAGATHGQAAPLEVVSQMFTVPAIHWLVAAGAMAAMLGVLLNLILGLSRVLLAMGRRGDMPSAVARLNADGTTPWVAVLIVGILIGGLALIGSVKTTWSFSAFTVLIYYALTNLCALRLKGAQRLYPRIFAWCGLGACLFLAFWVEPRIWVTGTALLGIGLLWHLARQRIHQSPQAHCH
jgi:APA family basic amino acid/polyamine antiporter